MAVRDYITNDALKHTGHGMMAAGAGLGLYTVVSGLLARHRFLKELRRQKKERVADLVASGLIPRNAVVVSSKDDVRKALVDEDRRRNRRGLLQRIRTALQSRSAANSVAAGTNMFYVGGPWDRPVFALPSEVPRSAAAHEVGHWLADKARKAEGDYLDEYEAAQTRTASPASLFRSHAIKTNDGRRTLLGLEAEAWDRAPGKVDPALRSAALESYRVGTRNTPLLLGAVGLVGAGVAARALSDHLSVKRGAATGAICGKDTP